MGMGDKGALNNMLKDTFFFFVQSTLPLAPAPTFHDETPHGEQG